MSKGHVWLGDQEQEENDGAAGKAVRPCLHAALVMRAHHPLCPSNTEIAAKLHSGRASSAASHRWAASLDVLTQVRAATRMHPSALGSCTRRVLLPDINDLLMGHRHAI